MNELKEQPVPSDTNCPYCGAEPTEESVVSHRLESLGYKSDDIHFECSECEEEWTCGVPIGEYWGPEAEELFCSSCEERFMLPHRLQIIGENRVRIHLKCPNCYFFDSIKRTGGTSYISFGYPHITGEFETDDVQGGLELE